MCLLVCVRVSCVVGAVWRARTRTMSGTMSDTILIVANSMLRGCRLRIPQMVPYMVLWMGGGTCAVEGAVDIDRGGLPARFAVGQVMRVLGWLRPRPSCITVGVCGVVLWGSGCLTEATWRLECEYSIDHVIVEITFSG